MTSFHLKRQYSSTVPLRVRIKTHELYEERRIDLDAVSVSLMRLRGQEGIIDVGCGTGRFIGYLGSNGHAGRLLGVDLSMSMVRECHLRISGQNIGWVVADAAHIPCANSQWSWVVARHMLYHVPSIQNTIREFGRILSPDGALLVTTNSALYLEKISALLDDMMVEFDLPARERSGARFTIESATRELSEVFPRVSLTVIENSLIFPSAAPVSEYAKTYIPSLDVPHYARHKAAMEHWLDEACARRIAAYGGVWRDTKSVGLFVCRQ